MNCFISISDIETGQRKSIEFEYKHNYARINITREIEENVIIIKQPDGTMDSYAFESERYLKISLLFRNPVSLFFRFYFLIDCTSVCIILVCPSDVLSPSEKSKKTSTKSTLNLTTTTPTSKYSERKTKLFLDRR